jgi:hypothetical protein
MPVIINMPADPFDVVLQGEQFRAAALGATVMSSPVGSNPVIAGGQRIPGSPSSLLAGMQDFTMMPSGIMPHARLRSQENSGMVAANNALIATPCGALVQITLGRHLFLKEFVQATDTFTITGQTLTGAGAALAGCRVVVYETGRIAVAGHYNPQAQAGVSVGNVQEVQWDSESPVVAEAISDGSGNFSIVVPMNLCYQLTGYLVGSPDRAGITKDTVVPGSVNIYLRDPTVADGPGGSAVYRPIGSAVVRRIDQ